MSETEAKATPAKGICPNDGRPFDIPPHVRGYKRFCSDKCRSEWHSRLRKKALEQMRTTEGNEDGN
jgi:hypothetical protein